MAIFVLERDIDDLIALPEVYNGQDYSTEIGPQFTLMGWGDYGPMSVFYAGENMWGEIDLELLIFSMDCKANGGSEMETLEWDGGPALIQNNDNTQ